MIFLFFTQNNEETNEKKKKDTHEMSTPGGVTGINVESGILHRTSSSSDVALLKRPKSPLNLLGALYDTRSLYSFKKGH